MGSKSTSESSALKKNNCSVHIFFLYIVLVVSIAITVSAVYIFNTSTPQKADVPYERRAQYKNESESSFDCGQVRYPKEDWYYLSRYNPGYACEPFKTVSSINIQSLHLRGHECNDTDHCYDFIRTYLGIMEEHSKFAYFIDNDANVYGARGWLCECFKGQIWVGVMVEGFAAASQTEKERVLYHLKEGIIPYEKHCCVNISELKLNYYDEITFERN